MSCEAHGTQMDSKGNKYDGFGKKEVSDSQFGELIYLQRILTVSLVDM